MQEHSSTVSQKIQEALSRTTPEDLRRLIESFYPGSTRFGSNIQAQWRGERTPSVGIEAKGDRPRWRDFGESRESTKGGGDAVDFLVNIVGMTLPQALRHLGITDSRSSTMGQPQAPNPEIKAHPEPPAAKTLSRAGHEVFRRSQREMEYGGAIPRTLEQRGISFEDALVLKLGRQEENTLFPVHNYTGEMVGVKIRQHLTPALAARHERQKRSAPTKYYYLEKGAGVHCWLSPGIENCSKVIVMEGEFNAMVSWLALSKQSLPIGVIGVPGASQSLPVALLKEREEIFLYADSDKAGAKAIYYWLKQAHNEGLSSKTRVLEWMPRRYDACEYAERYGQESLGIWLVKIMEAACNRPLNITGLYRTQRRFLAHINPVTDKSIRQLSIELGTNFPNINRYFNDMIKRGIIMRSRHNGELGCVSVILVPWLEYLWTEPGKGEGQNILEDKASETVASQTIKSNENDNPEVSGPPTPQTLRPLLKGNNKDVFTLNSSLLLAYHNLPYGISRIAKAAENRELVVNTTQIARVTALSVNTARRLLKHMAALKLINIDRSKRWQIKLSNLKTRVRDYALGLWEEGRAKREQMAAVYVEQRRHYLEYLKNFQENNPQRYKSLNWIWLRDWQDSSLTYLGLSRQDISTPALC